MTRAERTILALGASALLALSTACVDVRGRPGGPTGPDDDGPPRTSIVDITHPTEGQEVARSTFTDEPGLPVEFTGRFQEGEELLLLVFTDVSFNTPVFISQARVDREGVPRSTRVRLDSGTVEDASEVEIMLRVLEPGNGPIISTDSVGVVLR